jgi:hypothetical protein
MSSPQEQFTELTRRTQEGFKHLWQQWSEKGTELMKGATSRSHTTAAGGNPEEVLDAVFDFAEHLIAQQRIFAKQMLAATSHPQQSATQVTGATDESPPAAARAVETDPPKSTTTGTTSAAGTDTASSANQ